MKPIEFDAPTSLQDAIRLLGTDPGKVGLLSGGTDLIIQWRGGRRELSRMVDLKHIPELNVLEFDPARGLRLGAAVPCARLADFEPARQHYPALVEGAQLIGSMQIQSRASVGGNVCNGSPAADSICPLIVLGAAALVQGPRGNREIPAALIVTGPGQTALQGGEILVEFRVPAPAARSSSAYLRFIPRNEMDIAVVGAATSLALGHDGRTVTQAAIAVGAAGPTPIAADAAAKALVGKKIDEASLAAAAAAASGATKPITDLRWPAPYRRHLAGVLTRRTIETAARRARGEERL